MAWYDFFSNFYDASLEKLYADARRSAAEALAVAPGSVVLDLPCGTGQGFEALRANLGDGLLIGADASAGMLRRATERAARPGPGRVETLAVDARTVRASDLPAPPDRLHIFLGLTTFPDWEQAFENLWGLLAPGGRCVVVDVYAEHPDLQGKLVNLIARADIRRRTWEPLERLGAGFERRSLPARKEYGGDLWLATATKPA